MKPVIGLSTSFAHGEQHLDVRYLEAIVRSGGTPVVLPMLESLQDVYPLFKLIDGLLIPGGPAVTKGLTGELPEDIQEPDQKRIKNDSWMLECALEKKLPVFGICYGMQFVNAHFGGTILADVDAQRGLSASHSEKRGGSSHGFQALPGSRIQQLIGGRVDEVNSRHIQAIENVGTSLHVSGQAPDGVIESIESDDGLFLGVQFHPERMGLQARPLFDNLVQMAEQKAARHRPSRG